MIGILRWAALVGLAGTIGCSGGGTSADVVDVPVAQDIHTAPPDTGGMDVTPDTGGGCGIGFIPTSADQGCIVLDQTCMTGPVMCPDGTTISTTCMCQAVHMGGQFWRCDQYCDQDASPGQ